MVSIAVIRTVETDMSSEAQQTGGRLSAWLTFVGIGLIGTGVLWLITVGGRTMFRHVQLELEWDEVTAPVEQLGGRVAWWSDYDIDQLNSVGEIGAAIGLQNTAANDDDVRYIATTFPKIYGLNLSGTQVTDDGLAHLHQLTTLTTVTLNNTRVTQQGVKDLQTALPDCEIECRNPLPNQ